MLLKRLVMRLAQSGGVSLCAVRDGALPVFRDQRLPVVGGGDSATEEATYLATFASEVVIVPRQEECRASAAMAERARGFGHLQRPVTQHGSRSAGQDKGDFVGPP
jgi:thioredoxin reductase